MQGALEDTVYRDLDSGALYPRPSVKVKVVKPVTEQVMAEYRKYEDAVKQAQTDFDVHAYGLVQFNLAGASLKADMESDRHIIQQKSERVSAAVQQLVHSQNAHEAALKHMHTAQEVLSEKERRLTANNSVYNIHFTALQAQLAAADTAKAQFVAVCEEHQVDTQVRF